MTWRKILILVLIIYVAVLAVMAVIFSRTGAKLEEREVLGLRSLFPAGPARPLDLGEWKGFALPSRFRVLSSPCGEAPDLEGLLRKSFPRPHLIEPVSIGERGLYGLRRRSKGYVAAAIFKQGSTLFWLDVNSPHSILDHGRRAFHACLLNLKVLGRPPAPALAEELRRIESRISPFVMQSLRQFILFLAAIFAVVWVVLWFVMRLSGASPASASMAALCTPYQTMVIRRYGRKSSPCCLCLENGQVVIYRFRRETARVDLKQTRPVIDADKRRIAFGPYLFILDPDAFERWRVHVS
ncbi:MAG: hypothetical protein A2Y56_01975 [Candidatus Aminicenantes bacterium RBG_13_63_10]|nr:MAG: hypothetical protein A2Y56_01975 [Candidatus Aminicenantes bacterium RBG_13_63_10]